MSAYQSLDCISALDKFLRRQDSASENSIGFQVDAKASALAYLWETTPVLGTEALPIYANDEFKLPGAPWMIELN